MGSRNPSSRRSEEHTSELQSRQYLVCRLLLEKNNCPQPEKRHRRKRDSSLKFHSQYSLENTCHGVAAPKQTLLPRAPFLSMKPRPPRTTPFPYTTPFR